MPPSANTPPELLDELSAYLDGELDAERSRAIEEMLARDPAVRAEVQRLERAWQLLEELPCEGVDESFTQSTVAMLAVAAEQDLAQQTQALPTLQRRRWLRAAIGLAAAAALGFACVQLAAPASNQQLLRDLTVIEQLDEYRQAGDIEFLRLLTDAEVFPEEAAP
ncbi:MAG: anti-sigma factor [Pirellulales bacterium]